MERTDKPSVLITAYAVSSGRRLQDCGGATNSELVTDLFNRSKRNHIGGSSNNNNRNQSTAEKPRLDLSQIKGPTGTIRGHKDVVKKSLENIQAVSRWSKIMPICDLSPPNLTTFLGHNHQQIANNNNHSLPFSSIPWSSHTLDETYRSDYLNRLIDEEAGQCVAYTTTLGIIRRSFEDSRQMRSILSLNLIKYEERDIYLNQEYKTQLRLRCRSIIVPALFIDGQFVGGVEELEKINESGRLKSMFGKFKMLEMSRSTCQCCGNARFIACQNCHGSRKSAIHHFKFNSVALRCIRCDKNDGLVHCPLCFSEDTDSNSNNNIAESEFESKA